MSKCVASKWLNHQCHLGAATHENICQMNASNLRFQRPRKGANGYNTTTLFGVHTTHSDDKLATSPLPSRAPTCGQNGYITLSVFGVHTARRRDRIKKG